MCSVSPVLRRTGLRRLAVPLRALARIIARRAAAPARSSCAGRARVRFQRRHIELRCLAYSCTSSRY